MAEQEAPKIVLELMDKAEDALKRRNFDYAIELLGQAVEFKQGFPDSRKRLREVELIEFDQRTTPAFLHMIISAITTAIPTISASIQLSSKKYKQAMATCEKILKSDPENSTALVNLSKAAEGEGHIDVAVQSMEFARRLKPQNLSIIRRLGFLYKDNNQVDESKGCFQSILTRNSKDKEASKALKDLAALGTIKKGGWEDTTTYRDKIKDVDFSQKVEKEARAVLSEEDQESLEETYLKQIDREPGNIDNYRKLADLYIEGQEFDKALEIFDKAIAKFPDNVNLPQQKGRIESSKMEHQISKINEKLETNPDDDALKEELEKLTAQKNQFTLQNLGKQVKKYPNDLALRFQYGGTLLETGDVDEAIKQFQLSVKSAKFKAQSFGSLGKCFFLKGLLDFAINQYQKALEEAPSMDNFKKEALYNLGCIYEQQEETDLALEQFQEIYQEDIGYEDVGQRVEKLYAAKKKNQ
jgi:tetratricopeptide (TPR) repeat protein